MQFEQIIKTSLTRELLVESILDETPAPNFGDQTAPGAKVSVYRPKSLPSQALLPKRSEFTSIGTC